MPKAPKRFLPFTLLVRPHILDERNVPVYVVEKQNVRPVWQQQRHTLTTLRLQISVLYLWLNAKLGDPVAELSCC